MMSNAIKTTEAITPPALENNMISVIERMASNPEVDVEKLERVMAMQITILDREAEQEYTRAMVRVQSGLSGITRDKHNPQTHSMFVSLEAMKKAVVPSYTKEGFALSYGEGDSGKPDVIRITCKVMHSNGHSETFFYDNPVDDKGIKGNVNKTPTHGKSSAVTYAERYILKLIFNLTIQDEDDDGNAAGKNIETITEDQCKKIHALVTDNDLGAGRLDKLIKSCYHIDDLSDLPSAQYKSIISKINTAIEAKRESEK